MRNRTRTSPDRLHATAARISVGLAATVVVAAVGLLAATALAGNARQSKATISLRSSALGTFLVSSNGRTLYLFAKDRKGRSACVGQCAQFWPPLIARGKPTIGKGVRASLVRVFKRSDGRMQVSYNRHPLYTFLKDTKAGQTNGQGLFGFGAKWWVVSARGAAITKALPAAGGSVNPAPPPPTTTPTPPPTNPYP